MLIGEMHHDGPRSWSHAEMNAHTIMKHPPGGWMLHTFPCVMGNVASCP